MNSNKKLLLYVVYAVLILLVPEVVGTLGGNYWVRVLDFAMLYVMLALGLNVVVGFTGLLDLGYIAFYAVGAYTAALLSSPHLPTHFEWIAHAQARHARLQLGNETLFYRFLHQQPRSGTAHLPLV